LTNFYIDKGFKDFLVGRKYIFQLNPLSLKEFVEFKEGNDVLANRLPIMSWLEKEQFMGYYDEYVKYGEVSKNEVYGNFF
jgi:predicted AAA+ superfamily ATPase